MNNRKAGGNEVFWITGLSGAGKTTIGSLFYNRLKEKHPNTVFFDGDTLRQVFGDDLGYSKEDRKKCAMRYSRLCAMLEEQGINVVCCTISMFDSVRQWNREHIKNYKEIYVKVSMDTLKRRDQKGLYSNSAKGIEKDVAGLEIEVEEPKSPDLILYNDGQKTPQEQGKEMINFFGI